MRLIWSPLAQADAVRLHRFLAPKNPRAATQAIRGLRAAARRLLAYPQLGELVDGIELRDVRRIFVDDYELRYQVRGETIAVLRIWHTRENR